ncbi:hypothetical protein B0F90DRAFT_1743003 [Multifurca ochricompacta]|uniref:Uncharacterized protein n=1 Tax=Multifurca ochricompacta TaxID=376703 RepID=A0AAD4QLL5_9AGAM|nr:hypothetical protein B0F90DRAFT_1743003 [Multifurca ochricompacta]
MKRTVPCCRPMSMSLTLLALSSFGAYPVEKWTFYNNTSWALVLLMFLQQTRVTFKPQNVASPPNPGSIPADWTAEWKVHFPKS